MKRMKSAVAMLLCLLILCSCADPQSSKDTQPSGTTAEPLPAQLTYTVSVVDVDGNPVKGGVVVSFLKENQEVAMQIVNDQGVAEKVLPTGAYSVSLSFTDSSKACYYSKSDLSLSANKTSLTVTMGQAPSQESMRLNAYSQKKGEYADYEAHFVTAGATFVTLDQSDRTYVLFKPEESGMYQFSVRDSGAVLGYYGSEHFILTDSAAENGDAYSFTFNVSNSMIGTDGAGTTVMVLGLDYADRSECVLQIDRIGDAELTIGEMPWDVYENTSVLAPFVLPDNVTIRDFDMTAPSGSYDLVKGADGLYHLGAADGFVVYARLGSVSTYLDSIENILENSGMYQFIFDENGKCIQKESYTAALKAYIEHMDSISGLYPLTDDIIYMFQSHGAYVGWWDPDSPSYLFENADGDPIAGINNDLGWLFLCCYGETDPDDPCKNGHTEVTDQAKAATCTKDGLTEGKHCSVCGKILQEQKKVAATGHSYGEWVEVKAATADAEGLAERKCGTCGHTQQKVLDKLDSPDPGTDPDPGQDPEPVPEQIVGKPSNPGAPIELYPAQAMSFDVEAPSGEYVIYHIYRLSGVYLTIEDEFSYVVYDGMTYWPEDGKISILLTNDSVYTPIEVHIGNYGFDDRTIHVDCLYPLGDMMNPENLTIGSFTTVLEPGNDQGYYYNFTADSDGVLTIALDQVPAGVSCSVILYNLDSYEYVMMDGNTASVTVKAGQNVQIIISLSTDNYEFPGGTVSATAKFE